MGCDIHLYIEYRSKNAANTDQYWQSFGQRTNPGRNYFMFALLANVRNYDELPVPYALRGMPDDAGYDSGYDNRLYISNEFDEHTVTMERAEQWVKSGSSKFINNERGEPTWVTHPDWHSHSWLTTNEYENVINLYLAQPFAKPFGLEPRYQVVLASMKAFEQLGYDARIVFWFDN